MNKNKILNIYKPVGISLFDTIKILKEKYPHLKNEPITYAGRLDPVAEGVLILLAGKAVYEKEKYLNLDKEYEAEILFGFETDTYDIMGMPVEKPYRRRMSIDEIKTALKNFEGEITLPLPPYSSYKIKGRPIFQWAREDRLSEIKIPDRKMKIYEAKLLDLYEISGSELLKRIIEKINLVKGDFRQKEILERWNKILPEKCDRLGTVNFKIAKIKIFCSSGTYIRSIAHYSGKELGAGANLLSLTRKAVGGFKIKDSLKI